MVPTHQSAARLLGLALGLALIGGLGCQRGMQDGLWVPPFAPVWRDQHLPTYRYGTPGVGWEPHSGDGLQVAWRHSTDSAAIQIHGECDNHGDSDLEDFTDHMRIDFSEWTIIEEPTGELDAEGRPRMRQKQYYTTIADREALRTTVRANLDGADIAIEYVVLKKDGCLFDLTYIAVPAAFDQHTGEFEQVVEGFGFPVRR